MGWGGKREGWLARMMAEFGQKATFTGHSRLNRSGVIPLWLGWEFPILLRNVPPL